jgi:hypothetical protein
MVMRKAKGSNVGLLTVVAMFLMTLEVFVPDSCCSQSWVSIGPGGGIISAVALNPGDSNIVYAGTPGNGVFKSTDGA